MRHEVIICTRNRAADLCGCLESVANQSRLPDRLIVVDSSDTDAAQNVTEDFSRQSGLDVTFVRTVPRKTVQLNMAIAMLDESTDIVHFTDDDVILDPDYFSSILATFQDRPECAGVGGRILNPPQRRAKGIARWYRWAFLLDSPRQGALLSSGMNVMCRTGRRPRRVDWLVGCSMSYRRRCIVGLRFDETRAGNGMGEDVDFSARVAERAELIWTPVAVLEHRESPVNREDDLVVRRRFIRSRWRFAELGVSSVSRLAVLYAILGDTIMLLVMAVVLQSRHNMRQAVTNVVGVIDIIKRLPV